MSNERGLGGAAGCSKNVDGGGELRPPSPTLKSNFGF